MLFALVVCIFSGMNDTPECPHKHIQKVSAISLQKSYTWLEKKCTKSTALIGDPMLLFMAHSSVCWAIYISITGVTFQLTQKSEFITSLGYQATRTSKLETIFTCLAILKRTALQDKNLCSRESRKNIPLFWVQVPQGNLENTLQYYVEET